MPRYAPVLLLLVLIAGCGGGDDKTADRLTLTTPRETPTPSPSPSKSGGDDQAQAAPGGGSDTGDDKAAGAGPITAKEKAVVRGWSDALRRGDVEAAVRYWRVPAIASNGGQPVRLLSRGAIRFWNTSLPCGAKLESVERDANYVLATFRLTERPGKGRCGSGVGDKARTLFLVRGGKIIQWLRAADPAPASETPGGSSS
jgi:hypothetical protein